MGKPFGGMKATGGGGVGAQSANKGFENFLAQGINSGSFGTGMFGNAINSMLSGNPGDPNSLAQYFNNAQQGTGGLMPGQFQVGNTYSPAQFQGFTPQNPGVANGSFNAPSWIDAASQASINPATLNSGFGTTAQLGSAGSADVLGEHSQAVQQILSRQLDRGVGDLRARYGASGSGLGSNAQYAESNFRAEALPQIANALGNINQQERGLNLQQRGQDLQNFMGGRQADISQMGAMLQNAGLLQNQNLAQNQFNQGNAQFGANLGLQAQGMNMDSIAQLNALMQNQNQFQNQFGMQNAQNQAQFEQTAGLANASNMLQNQQMQNQYGLGQAQIGLGLQGNQMQAQQFGIQQLMNALMQNQGLNTAQRQQVYQPGWVQQGLGAAGQIAGIAGQFMNPFAGMAGNAMSAIGGFNPQASTPNMMNTSFGQYPSYGGGLQWPTLRMGQ
jgi:hypothetical protein